MTNRQLFLNHVGQTSLSPLSLEVVKAEGCKMWDANGKEYIDLIAGISVCNVGHRHPKVIEAIKKQSWEEAIKKLKKEKFLKVHLVNPDRPVKRRQPEINRQ